MSLPSPQERPDLYDYYDGLPEGQVSAVKTTDSPFQAQLIKERQAALAAQKGQAQAPAAPSPAT